MKPRDFVSSFSTRHGRFNGGVYSVGLSIDGYLLDYQFHINRLKYSHELILPGCTSSDNFLKYQSLFPTSSLGGCTLSELVLERCGDALRSHEILSSTKNPYGVITMCYSLDPTNYQPYVEALFTPMSFDFAGMNSWPKECIVNLQPWERRIKEAKYCAWVEERKHLELREPSISETLMLTDWGEDGCHISEGLVSNIFVVDKDGLVVIPPTGSCLEGSMSQLVIACLEYLKVQYSRRPLKLTELATWQGMFLTSATKHIHPIGQVSRNSVSDHLPLSLPINDRISITDNARDLILSLRYSNEMCDNNSLV